MKLLEKLSAKAGKAFKNDSPKLIRTMKFKEAVTIPYTKTIYREMKGSALVGEMTFITYNPPKVVHKSYQGTRYTQYEARKHETASGARYEINHIEVTIPGLKTDEDRVETPMLRLVTKEDALTYLQEMERKLGQTKAIASDGAHTRKYLGRYLPRSQ